MTGFDDYTPDPDPRPQILEVSPPSKPLSIARDLMSTTFSTDSVPTLVRWEKEFWAYTGTHWAIRDEEALRGDLYRTLENACYIDKDGDVRDFNPTSAKVTQVTDTLRVAASEAINERASQPAWLGNGPNWHDTYEQPVDPGDPRNYVAVANGILNWKTRTLYPHSAAFFTHFALEFDYDPSAACPNWQGFLDEVFSHDPGGALLLQEFAGYLISGATNQHKALMIIGPRRGGKGTISRTLRQLVGDTNTVSISLGNLASRFGLLPLVGKPLAVVEDARADDERRSNTLTERLNNITGEDAVSVEGKGKDIIVTKLPTRFMIVSNEVPAFFDSSGAIVSRFMAIRLQKSFEGKEDRYLGERINTELPGILNWALEGLDRLHRQGTFTIPDTQEDTLDFMGDVASPITVFFDETDGFEVTGNHADHVLLKTVHRALLKWLDDTGRGRMKQETFVQKMEAAYPDVRVKNTAIDGQPKARRAFGVCEKDKNVFLISRASA